MQVRVFEAGDNRAAVQVNDTSAGSRELLDVGVPANGIELAACDGKSFGDTEAWIDSYDLAVNIDRVRRSPGGGCVEHQSMEHQQSYSAHFQLRIVLLGHRLLEISPWWIWPVVLVLVAAQPGIGCLGSLPN